MNLFSVEFCHSLFKVASKLNMKFYHCDSSPPCRAVLMTIRNLDLDVEIHIVDLIKGDQMKPEFLKVNPQHQVPVLVDGELTLTESRAIQAYLVNAKKPGNSLYPSDAKSRAIVDQRLYFDATTVFPALVKSLVRFNYRSQLSRIA